MFGPLCIEKMYRFLDPELCGYNHFAIYLISFNRPLLLKKHSKLENLEDSGYNSTLLENSLLAAEDIHIVNCQSTPIKNGKVQNISYDMGLTEFKDIFQGYFDVEKIECKSFTKKIKTATRKWVKANSCAKIKYYEHFSPENWTKLKPKKKIQSNLQRMFAKICSYHKLVPIKI